MSRRLVWILWFGATIAVAGFLALSLESTNRGVFLPGKTTSGHYQIEVSCEKCHTPLKGVLSDACLACHEQDLAAADDSHPKSKFTDPRNADRLSRLDATSCITCHVEHRPEMTQPMGVTLPGDYCFYCHADVGKERPSHTGMAFDSCASAGCHRFHDNQSLYADFLVKHREQPHILARPIVLPRSLSRTGTALTSEQHDAPRGQPVSPAVLTEWVATEHARAGVNCSGCHTLADAAGEKKWTDQPDYRGCRSCHDREVSSFLQGKHGMRIEAGLPPMSPSLARLAMADGSAHRLLGCSSCHAAHEFDTRRAAAEACLECHADKHSLAYKASSHFALWRAEIDGSAAVGSGVSCATCHLPRLAEEVAGARVVRVQHNQNANLRPNEKMIREVCMSCHGLGFSIDALADAKLVEANFRGSPTRHIESIDMAVRKAAQ